MYVVQFADIKQTRIFCMSCKWHFVMRGKVMSVGFDASHSGLGSDWDGYGASCSCRYLWVTRICGNANGVWGRSHLDLIMRREERRGYQARTKCTYHYHHLSVPVSLSCLNCEVTYVEVGMVTRLAKVGPDVDHGSQIDG